MTTSMDPVMQAQEWAQFARDTDKRAGASFDGLDQRHLIILLCKLTSDLGLIRTEVTHLSELVENEIGKRGVLRPEATD